MNVNREEAKKYVGAGWSDIIDKIYDVLPEDAIIIDIKEKFGGLRFYAGNIDLTVEDFICEMEEKSLQTCEVCGEPGELRETGWIKTLCDKHYRLRCDNRIS